MNDTTHAQVKADDLPEDLRALLQILSGLELLDRVVDEATHRGDGIEAVAEARRFLRQQHAGVVQNIKDHPQSHLVLKKEDDDNE